VQQIILAFSLDLIKIGLFSNVLSEKGGMFIGIPFINQRFIKGLSSYFWGE